MASMSVFPRHLQAGQFVLDTAGKRSELHVVRGLGTTLLRELSGFLGFGDIDLLHALGSIGQDVDPVGPYLDEPAGYGERRLRFSLPNHQFSCLEYRDERLMSREYRDLTFQGR